MKKIFGIAVAVIVTATLLVHFNYSTKKQTNYSTTNIGNNISVELLPGVWQKNQYTIENTGKEKTNFVLDLGYDSNVAISVRSGEELLYTGIGLETPKGDGWRNVFVLRSDDPKFGLKDGLLLPGQKIPLEVSFKTEISKQTELDASIRIFSEDYDYSYSDSGYYEGLKINLVN